MTTCTRADAGAWFNYTFLTLKERDNETGLDYFGARYYASTQGRFTSADEFNAILNKQALGHSSDAELEFAGWISEPQRWNKYTYSLNNPLKYLDDDGNNPQSLEKLQKAIQRLGGFRGLAKALVSKGNVAATATQIALETLLGNSISFAPTGLNSAEIEFAKEVSAFEGRSFLGIGKAAPGIDGFLHTGQSPTNNPQAVQLQENSTGGDYRIFDDATRHENQAAKAGRANVDLYVKSTDKNVTVGSVLNFIQKGGTGGLVGVTNRGTFKSVTILTQDGAVRIDRGKVTSCDNNGRCQAQ
ncbi:MAG: RHS repeat-associated core domain-containing protein [Pyrinomonadaceae bacterium]